MNSFLNIKILQIICFVPEVFSRQKENLQRKSVVNLSFESLRSADPDPYSIIFPPNMLILVYTNSY